MTALTPTTTDSKALEIHEVSHRFDAEPVVRDVSLRVAKGEVHCLLGPSGSGKSTLLRLIAGLETLQEGHLLIDGAEVARPGFQRSPEQRRIGLVFQDYALFPHLNVRRNVLFGMPRGPEAERHEKAEALLRQVGMADFATAMPHTLSGGQQQRVALARALARQPVVMLLDEPFSGLDERLREDVREATLDVLREAGVATVMVTHDPREALVSADRVSVIQGGRLLQTGPPVEVYERPKSRDVAEVFGPINEVRGIVSGGRIASPWGEIQAPDDSPADLAGEVTLLARPEAFQLQPANGSGPHAVVKRCVFEGAVTRWDLDLPDGSPLRVKDLARHCWAVGEAVNVVVAGPVAVLADS